jgi:hypothetical protein
MSSDQERIKKLANHGLLGCSQRLSGIVRLGLPAEQLEKELQEWHRQVQEVVKLINEL